MDPLSFAAAGVNLIGGLFSTFSAAKQAKTNARYAVQEYEGAFQQVGIQNQALLDESAALDRQTKYAVAQRIEQSQKLKDTNEAWMSSSGTAFNASQAIADKRIDKTLRADITVASYNAALQKKRISDQIKVNRMSLETAKNRAAATISQGTATTIGTAIGAGVDFVGSLVKNAPVMGK